MGLLSQLHRFFFALFILEVVVKYRGKVLEEEVAEAAEEIIRETGKERDIEVIDMVVNVDHVH